MADPNVKNRLQRSKINLPTFRISRHGVHHANPGRHHKAAAKSELLAKQSRSECTDTLGDGSHIGVATPIRHCSRVAQLAAGANCPIRAAKRHESKHQSRRSRRPFYAKLGKIYRLSWMPRFPLVFQAETHTGHFGSFGGRRTREEAARWMPEGSSPWALGTRTNHADAH